MNLFVIESSRDGDTAFSFNIGIGKNFFIKSLTKVNYPTFCVEADHNPDPDKIPE